MKVLFLMTRRYERNACNSFIIVVGTEKTEANWMRLCKYVGKCRIDYNSALPSKTTTVVLDIQNTSMFVLDFKTVLVMKGKGHIVNCL